MQPNLHRVLMLVIAAALLAGCGQPTPASPTPQAAAANGPIYTVAGTRAAFAYPLGWKETAPGELTGADGFARAELRSSQGAGPGAVCQGEANRASPNPYGDLPEIRDLQVNGYPAGLIVPSGQPPAAAQGALFVWLAAGALTSDSGGDLLVLTADPAHIESVAGSLSLP